MHTFFFANISVPTEDIFTTLSILVIFASTLTLLRLILTDLPDDTTSTSFAAGPVGDSGR
jgi:hypothetical protein